MNESTFTIHLPNGHTLPHLDRASAIQAIVDNPTAKLEQHADSESSPLKNAQEVADMYRDVMDIRGKSETYEDTVWEEIGGTEESVLMDHNCLPPDEWTYTATVWICPVCALIWEIHTDTYWAPSEGRDGKPLYSRATVTITEVDNTNTTEQEFPPMEIERDADGADGFDRYGDPEARHGF